MSFMDAYNEAMGSFQDAVRETLYGDAPSDDQLIGMLARKYSPELAAMVARVLKEDTQFSAAVRRSLVREWYR